MHRLSLKDATQPGVGIQQTREIFLGLHSALVERLWCLLSICPPSILDCGRSNWVECNDFSILIFTELLESGSLKANGSFSENSRKRVCQTVSRSSNSPE